MRNRSWRIVGWNFTAKINHTRTQYPSHTVWAMTETSTKQEVISNQWKQTRHLYNIYCKNSSTCLRTSQEAGKPKKQKTQRVRPSQNSQVTSAVVKTPLVVWERVVIICSTKSPTNSNTTWQQNNNLCLVDCSHIQSAQQFWLIHLEHHELLVGFAYRVPANKKHQHISP